MAPNDLTPCRMAFYFVSTFAIAQTPTKQPALRLSRTKNLHFAKAPFPGFSAREQENFGGAIDEAVKERVKKGRNEVSVKLINGNLAFGLWQAKSIISATYRPTSYHVYIRSLEQRKNYCTCPDLATNRLGTYKLIEAVLHYAKKQPGYSELPALGAAVSFIYLA